MHWFKVDTAPFDRDLELAVIDFGGVHPVTYPCRRIFGGWVHAATRVRVKILPTHWRQWDKFRAAIVAEHD